MEFVSWVNEEQLRLSHLSCPFLDDKRNRRFDKESKRLFFFFLGEEGEEADDDCKYVCVPQVSFLEQNLCMSLSIKREETERVVWRCVMETVSAKSLQMSGELLANDAVMSFWGRWCVTNRWPPVTVSNAVKWLRLCKFLTFSTLQKL